MINLAGSEKQIEWAVKIKADFNAKMIEFDSAVEKRELGAADYLSRKGKYPGWYANLKTVNCLIAELKDAVNNQASSKCFIEDVRSWLPSLADINRRTNDRDFGDMSFTKTLDTQMIPTALAGKQARR